MVVVIEGASLQKDGVTILHDINWKIREREHWVLYGLNGSGKTALLNIINAYQFPSKGKVTVLDMEFGKTYLGEKLRKQIGYVSSSLQEKLYPNDNAFEVVLSGAFASIGLYETPSNDLRLKAIGLLKELGCIDYANRLYSSLSQGEKQRVLIARALMAEPQLLILDEPTNGLDFIAREKLLESIDKLATTQHSPTIIYVTHHLEEILSIFNKVLLLKDGQVFLSGKPSEVISSNQLSKYLEMPVTVKWENDRPRLVRNL